MDTTLRAGRTYGSREGQLQEGSIAFFSLTNADGLPPIFPPSSAPPLEDEADFFDYISNIRYADLVPREKTCDQEKFQGMRELIEEMISSITTSSSTNASMFTVCATERTRPDKSHYFIFSFCHLLSPFFLLFSTMWSCSIHNWSIEIALNHSSHSSQLKSEQQLSVDLVAFLKKGQLNGRKILVVIGSVWSLSPFCLNFFLLCKNNSHLHFLSFFLRQINVADSKLLPLKQQDSFMKNKMN